MAYETIADFDCNKTIALGGIRDDKKTGKRYKNPTKIEGYFVGSKTGIENKLNPDKPTSLHIFQTAEGNVGVWGKTDLDQKMKRAKPGLMTLVEFTGLVPTNKKPMYKYSVKQDPQNVNSELAAAGLAVEAVEEALEDAVGTARPTYGEEAFEDEVFEEEPALEDEEAPVDEAPVARAKAPATVSPQAADRQAATKRLLEGNKKTA